jgi:hypothetical protein
MWPFLRAQPLNCQRLDCHREIVWREALSKQTDLFPFRRERPLLVLGIPGTGLSAHRARECSPLDARRSGRHMLFRPQASAHPADLQFISDQWVVMPLLALVP